MGNYNPMAKMLRTEKASFQTRRTKTTDEKIAQNDGWDRNGKYKVNHLDVDDDGEVVTETFQVGDNVTLDGKKGMVKNPSAPLGLVGVTVDGKYMLVHEDSLKLIEGHIQRMLDLSK